MVSLLGFLLASLDARTRVETPAAHPDPWSDTCVAPFWKLFGIIARNSSGLFSLFVLYIVFSVFVDKTQPKLGPKSIDCDHPFSSFVRTSKFT